MELSRHSSCKLISGSCFLPNPKLGAKSEIARELAYRLYVLCERKKRTAEALAYNGLVQSWPEITRLARETSSKQTSTPTTGDLFDE